MKPKIEIPIEVELQLIEMGINILELTHDIEKLLEAEEILMPTFSSDLVH